MNGEIDARSTQTQSYEFISKKSKYCDFYTMNFAQNHLVSPVQLVETTSIVGKVIRIRPNVYSYACDYCTSQHQSIDNFLRHTESHFQHSGFSNMALASSTRPMVQTPAINSIGSMAAPYPVHLQQSQAAPVNVESHVTGEVYEIIDLGYDYEGNYPNAQNIDAIPIDEENHGQNTKPKPKRKQAKPTTTKVRGPKARRQPKARGQPKSKNSAKSANFRCSFCVRDFNKDKVLQQHLVTTHAKILKKIDTTPKKAFKCKICGQKFLKDVYILDDAYEHLKIHYNN